jgi:hypothetical protein
MILLFRKLEPDSSLSKIQKSNLFASSQAKSLPRRDLSGRPNCAGVTVHNDGRTLIGWMEGSVRSGRN